MLKELKVKDLGTVKTAKLCFNPGLTVLAGESGAGKSILLNSLKLVLGGKANSGLVRSDSAKLLVDSVWGVTSEEDRKAFEEIGASFEDEELYISRTVEAGGGSRLVLGGSNSPTAPLKGLASNLVEIHGQSEQLRLKDPKEQRLILDSFGGEKVSIAKEAYAKVFKEWSSLKKAIKELQENFSKREIEFQYNQDFVKRVEDLDPQPGELEELESTIQKISHIEDLATGVSEINSMLDPQEGESPYSMLQEISDKLASLSKYDSSLDQISEDLAKNLDDLAVSLKHIEAYSDTIDIEQLEALHEYEDRFLALTTLAKPFSGDLENVFEAYDKAKAALESYEETSLEELEKDLKLAEESMKTASEALTLARKEASEILSKAVNEELEALAMKGTALIVAITPEKYSSSGADSIEFLIETHGKNQRPIVKAASGGELSRIMLSIELVLAKDSAPKTFIFDEVDSGVGGATALEIGKRLKQLAVNHQVIVVSHLAQVASFAANIFRVSKTDINEETESHVEELVLMEDKIEEIARMLSGMKDSKSALAHAEELMKNASLGEN